MMMLDLSLEEVHRISALTTLEEYVEGEDHCTCLALLLLRIMNLGLHTNAAQELADLIWRETHLQATLIVQDGERLVGDTVRALFPGWYLVRYARGTFRYAILSLMDYYEFRLVLMPIDTLTE